VETALDVSVNRRGRRDGSARSRFGIIWALLFFNVLNPAGGALVPIPHKVAQLISQGALFIALVLALTINPRLRVRPNWFLGLFTLLALTSLMMSVRFVGLGTAYRSFRLIGFLSVLWLLTPWWGRRDMLLLRSQMRFLLLILGSVVLGLLISPGRELGGRLSGTLWPIPPTQVAHFAAELVGLTTLLWFCRLLSGRRALWLLGPGLVILVLTHTRTALTAMVAGLLVAGTSLFLAKRRVRKSLATALIVVLVIAIPASPFLADWLTRGESSQQLQSLTGRTQAWSAVLSAHRPTTNVVFGSGLTNDSVNDSSNPAVNGLPIDSSWISIYQDQGIVGEVLVSAALVLLLLAAIFRARGPTRAMALFLIVYCIIAGVNESGLGGASQYLLDLTVAASLLTFPSAAGTDLTFSLGGRSDAARPLDVRRPAELF
jgi:O-Antigen ligase